MERAGGEIVKRWERERKGEREREREGERERSKRSVHSN